MRLAVTVEVVAMPVAEDRGSMRPRRSVACTTACDENCGKVCRMRRGEVRLAVSDRRT